MDSVVARAMAKWPNVPAVYGWLSLDRRGNWLIKGERITNGALREFIARNYEAQADGRWYFQNGPQRVYVTLAYTPLVHLWRACAAQGQSGHERVAQDTPLGTACGMIQFGSGVHRGFRRITR
jgi:hypothetical protein